MTAENGQSALTLHRRAHKFTHSTLNQVNSLAADLLQVGVLPNANCTWMLEGIFVSENGFRVVKSTYVCHSRTHLFSGELTCRTALHSSWGIAGFWTDTNG